MVVIILLSYIVLVASGVMISTPEIEPIVLVVGTGIVALLGVISGGIDEILRAIRGKK